MVGSGSVHFARASASPEVSAAYNNGYLNACFDAFFDWLADFLNDVKVDYVFIFSGERFGLKL